MMLIFELLQITAFGEKYQNFVYGNFDLVKSGKSAILLLLF